MEEALHTPKKHSKSSKYELKKSSSRLRNGFGVQKRPLSPITQNTLGLEGMFADDAYHQSVTKDSIQYGNMELHTFFTVDQDQSRLCSKRGSTIFAAAIATQNTFSDIGLKYVDWTSTKSYLAVSTLFVCVALYLRDVAVICIPKAYDGILLNGVLTVLFVWFFLEMIANSLWKKGYLWSFFFWLDLVGTLSMLIDIPWILLDLTGVSVMTVAKGGRIAKTARAAGTMRVTKLMKMVRMARLFRLGKLLQRRDDETDDEETAYVQSNLRAKVSDKIVKKIVVGVLALLVIIPLFEVSEMDQSPYLTQDLLANAYGLYLEDPTEVNTNAYEEAIQNFKDTVETCFYLRASNSDEDDIILDENVDLRDFAVQILEVKESISYPEVSTLAKVDMTDLFKKQSLNNIYLCSFVMVAFAFGSFYISQDTYKIVIKPIEKMMNSVKRLTCTIRDISANDETETETIEKIVIKMAQIFQVKSYGKRSAVSKAMQLASGQNIVYFRVKENIVRVHVQERPLGIRDVDLTVEQLATSEQCGEVEFSIHQYPVFESMSSMIASTQLVAHLRLYFIQELCLENYAFIIESGSYKEEFMSRAVSIFKKFLTPSGVLYLGKSTPQEEIQEIQNEVYVNPQCDTFSNLREQQLDYLQKEHFENFLKSQCCKDYVFRKRYGQTLLKKRVQRKSMFL